MLELNNKEIQEVSGLFDEAIGKATNAITGVAIRERQINSVKNQVFAFDNLRMMKKREARLLLNFIQGGGDEYIKSQVVSKENNEIMLLNIVREVNGQKVVFNDIRTLPLSLYVEEVPDIESSREEQQNALTAIFNNPNAMLLLQSPDLLSRFGVRDYEKLAMEMQAISAQQQQLENGSSPKQGASGTVPPA